MLTLTYQTFEDALLDHPLLLVDFFAPWCTPCTLMRPVLEQLSQEYPQLTVAKVDVDEEEDLAVENNISLLPTLILYRDGKESERILGTMTLPQLVSKLKLS